MADSDEECDGEKEGVDDYFSDGDGEPLGDHRERLEYSKIWMYLKDEESAL